MRKTLALVFLGLLIALFNPVGSVEAQDPGFTPQPIQIKPQLLSPLQPIDVGMDCNASHCLGWDEQIWDENGQRGDRTALLTSIDNSLRYLATDKAIATYQNYPIKEINLDRVRRSLLRFRELLVNSQSPAQLQAAIQKEFVYYQSIGNDGNGTVKYTAYYEPVYAASRVRTAEYKYPIYRRPSNFEQWAKPHPTRVALEGKDGLHGDQSRLRGLELFWLRDRWDAYMIHIQGSAQLKLTDGTTTSVGYNGGTDYAWTSIGKELSKDGKLPAKSLSLPGMTRYFHEHPQEMNNYLPRWERFVFFSETSGGSAVGSILVPVTAERSIATDKSIMPPGALAMINTSLPYPTNGGKLVYRTVNRFVLDQDTGSAIKGPGRVDYFMGAGELAGDRAGVTGGDGKLFYLLLRD